MGATVDSLDIQIAASAEKANNAVNSIIARLDALSNKLSGINTKKIKIDIDISAVKNLDKLKYSVERAFQNTKIDTSKIGENLTRDFNITSKKVSKDISSQFDSILENAINKFDGSGLTISGKSFNALVESIAKSGKIAKGEMNYALAGLEEEYRDFYDYFTKHKLYISDFLKTDIGKSEFASILQTNLSNITRDAARGININSYWEELVERFPTILPKDINNAADQVITVLQKIGEVREQIKPIEITNLIGNDYDSAIQNIKDKISSSLNEAKSTILKDATKIYNEPQDKTMLPISINEDMIVTQIQAAVRKASRIKYEPLKINLEVDAKKIKSDLGEKLRGIDLAELSETFSKLKNISFDVKPITEMANAISILGRKSAATGIENVPKLTNAVKDMLAAFSQLPAIDSNIVQMTQSLAELSKNGNSLSNAMLEMKNAAVSVENMPEPKIFGNAARSITDFEKNLTDFKNDMQSISDIYGGMSNVPKGFLDNPIAGLKQSLEELKQSFPGATDLISEFEKEILRLQEISKGLTKETVKVSVDTNPVEQARQKMEEIKQKFAGRDWNWNFTGNFEQLKSNLAELEASLARYKQREQEAISSGKIDVSGFEKLQAEMSQIGSKIDILQSLKDGTELFNQSLQQLKIPPIHEENLTKLQNTLKKVEEETEKLRIKLANGITMGRIVPNVDDSGFQKLTEQIALSEKQVEALRQKIREAGDGTNGTDGKLNEMKAALTNVSSQSNRTSSAANALKKNIMKLSSALSGFNASANRAITGMKSFTRQAMSAMGVYLGIYGAVRGIKKSIDISSDLTEIQNVVDATFGDMAYKVEEFAKTSIEKFGMSEVALKQYSSRFQSMGSAMGISSKSIGNANLFLEKQTKGYIKASDSMSDVSLNLTKLTADMASFYNVEQKAVAEDLAAIFTGQTRPLRTYGLDLTQATLAEWALKNGMDADIKSMSQAEKTMLRYQYVLANTKAAHNDFSRTALTWANQTRILKQNFEQLATVIGGALINAFKPVVIVINKAMGSIISFAKTISNALGQIFGWTFEEGGGGLTQDFDGAAEGAEDIADSTGTAAKNIDKMQKGIRAFDELKVIDLQKPDSGSGGGDSGDGAGGTAGEGLGGEWKPGESILKKFTSEIDSLYKLGEYIGKTLTDALNSIKWDSVYESARNFGEGLADFLNGLISPELFTAIGNTIAGAINTVLHFLDSFGETFDFGNFGISIGAGINAALGGIDWETALSAAKNWGTGIGDAINGFFKETDFSLVGSTLANALNTAIQFALNLGTTLDFKQIGLSIADSVNGFFATFSFADLAKTINVWVQGLWEILKTAIANVNWLDVYDKIIEFLENLDIKTVAIIIGALSIKKIGKAILSQGIFSWIGTTLSKLITGVPIVLSNIKILAGGGLIAETGFVSKLANALALAAGGASTLHEALVAAFGTVATTIAGVVSSVGGALLAVVNFVSMLKDGFSWLKEALMVLGVAITAIGAVILGVPASIAAAVAAITAGVATAVVVIHNNWDSIVDFFKGLWNGIKSIWKGAASWFNTTVVTPTVNFFRGLKDKVSGFFKDLWNGIISIWKEASKWFNKEVVMPVVNLFQQTRDKIHSAFSMAWLLVKNIWNVVSSWFITNIKDPVVTTFETLKDKIHSAFSNAWNLVKNVWNTVGNWFSKNIKDPVTNTFNGLKINIKDKLSEAWELVSGIWNKASGWFEKNVKKPVTEKFQSLRDGMKGAFKDAYDGITNTFGAIGGFFKRVADDILAPIKEAVKGIAKAINWVLEKVGSKTRIDVNGFATGSNGLPQDTIGIVNDQKGSTYKELIVPPHGEPFIPKGRDVMLPMEKGTKIMPARQTKDFMQKMSGMPHFAGGIGDFFSGTWAKITEFTGNIWDYISDPGNILQIAFDKFTNLSGMLEPILSIAKGAASTLLNGATDFIKKIFDEELTVQYNPSKGIEQWRGLASKALQITNQFTPSNLTALLAQMQHESSGNPRAINLWDANAKKGTPSKGLMQVIDSTFRAYALSPHNKDIWDPLSNMIAAIRYTVSRYGSLYSGWTARGYKGYASGIGKINFGNLIPQYRLGGFPEEYSLFMAGERGRAEILGTVGGKTAVAGGAEITGIVSAVKSASAAETQLLREQNQLLKELLKKDFGITKTQIGEAARDYSREYMRTKGIPAYEF